jgi:molecular chaperone HscB
MNPFEVLGVSASFDVDLGALEKRHRELSRALHPDKFAMAGAAERRIALGRAAEVNEAWRIVRDPVKRAEALFRLAGVEVGERNEPAASPALLMDMMEKREALAEARASRDKAALERFTAEVAEAARGCERALAAGFAAHGDARALLPRLGELRFYARFLEEASAIEEELEGAA